MKNLITSLKKFTKKSFTVKLFESLKYKVKSYEISPWVKLVMDIVKKEGPVIITINNKKYEVQYDGSFKQI